jgi:hypothetical protein
VFYLKSFFPFFYQYSSRILPFFTAHFEKLLLIIIIPEFPPLSSNYSNFIFKNSLISPVSYLQHFDFYLSDGSILKMLKKHRKEYKNTNFTFISWKKILRNSQSSGWIPQVEFPLYPLPFKFPYWREEMKTGCWYPEPILQPMNLEFVKDLWLPNIFIYNLKTYKVREHCTVRPCDKTVFITTSTSHSMKTSSLCQIMARLMKMLRGPNRST